MSGHLADLSLPRVRQAITASSVVVLPVGATEQHGPHLPLSTDTVIAHETAEAVLAAAGAEVDLWLLPTLAVSKSTEHAWAPGTIWLEPHTLAAVLDDIGRSVATTGARRLVLLNGHGGNSTLLNVACRELRRAHGLLTFLVHPFVPPAYGGVARPEEQGMGIHGGHTETSVMLHLRPDLVDLAAATRNVPDWLVANTHVRFGGLTQFGWLANDFGPAGHIGDPTTATAEAGREEFEGAVALLADQLREIAHFDFPDAAECDHSPDAPHRETPS